MGGTDAAAQYTNAQHHIGTMRAPPNRAPRMSVTTPSHAVHASVPLPPVDAVITWVDGDDPAHRAKREAWLATLGTTPPPAARAARFHDAGEIDWCIASIFRFAPWLRTLHVVTDAQVPAVIVRLAGTPHADRVRVVDHCEVFAGFEDSLPTFNSRAIITALWRIDGLAERFVYFNDDFMLLRPVARRDFFTDDDRMVLRGKWQAQSHRRWTRRLANLLKRLKRDRGDRAGNHDAQEASARLAGFDDRYYRLFHNPYPFRRSTMRAYFEAHPEALRRNLSYRLRSSEQFKGEGLATHLEIASGNALRDNTLHTVQLKPRQQSPARVRAKMQRADADANAAFVCVQSLELASPEMQAEIIAWLQRRIGDPRAVFAAA